jgi:hypothetical protein
MMLPLPQCFLKTLAQRADARSVADANLFPDEAGFSPRPAWQVIEAARRRYLTGELTLPTTPATRIFLRDGLVYFAERSSDGTLPIRLMVEGVITREQMQGGTVIVNGVEHLGRLFDSDPSIDRASVELCVELFTDDVMISVANEVVPSYDMTLYRRHPSGIDRWYPHSVPVTGRQSDTPDQSAAKRATSEAAAATAAAAKPKPRPQAQESEAQKPAPRRTDERQPDVQPAAKAEVRPTQTPEPAPERKAEQRNNLNAPPITQAVPITASAQSTVPPPPITQAVPTISPITTQVPLANMPPPTAQIPVTAPKASSEVDAAAIADEVAAAIKRAFAGMGSGH